MTMSLSSRSAGSYRRRRHFPSFDLSKFDIMSFFHCFITTTTLHFAVLLILLSSFQATNCDNMLLVVVDAFLFFGRKKRQREKQRQAELLAQRLKEEAQARHQLIILCICAIIGTALLLLIGTYIVGLIKKGNENEDVLRGNRPDAPVDVILIMSAPDRLVNSGEEEEEETAAEVGTTTQQQEQVQMGQHHLRQLLEMSNVNIRSVVLVSLSYNNNLRRNNNHSHSNSTTNNNHHNNPTTPQSVTEIVTATTTKSASTTIKNNEPELQNELKAMGIDVHTIDIADFDDCSKLFQQYKTSSTSKSKPLAVFLATEDFRSLHHGSTTAPTMKTSAAAGDGGGIIATLFTQCITFFKPTVIYMDPPTFLSLSVLEQMKEQIHTDSLGRNQSGTRNISYTATTVYIGYVKHIMDYVMDAIELSKTIDNSHVFFCHNNNYNQTDLPNVFSKYYEGIMKHMAIEELSICTTYLDLTLEKIRKFKVNTGQLFTEKLTIWKPGCSTRHPEYLSDYSRCAFKITPSTDTISTSIMCDRCGGTTSFVVVKDPHGNEVEKFIKPSSSSTTTTVDSNNDDDFLYYLKELKNEIITRTMKQGTMKNYNHRNTNKNNEIIQLATLDTTIEAMRLAEYCSDKVKIALKKAKEK